MDLLECAVMPYAWGSRTAIAELTGRPSPSPSPEAELWMGAHPVAPSRVVRAGAPRSLADVIAEAPERELGPETAHAFGGRLPFLLKVLAAAEPLSIQVHPNMEQARAGFDDEERRGVPRDAPNRNYRDASHKPELLCALSPFDAVCGFRSIGDTIALFEALAVRELDDALAPLVASRDSAGLAETFRRMMTSPKAVVDAVVDACRTDRGGARFARERALAVRLAELYPGDVGVATALLLNVIRLEPGEAIYLDAGIPHAYLEGTGVEIMASSDNVLRGGLTKKHVDVPELVRITRFSDGPVAPIAPRALDEGERVYDTPAHEFRLSVLEIRSGASVARSTRGPEILLVTRGACDVRAAGGDGAGGDAGGGGVKLTRGSAAFVPASVASYRVNGDATVYRATVGEPSSRR